MKTIAAPRAKKILAGISFAGTLAIATAGIAGEQQVPVYKYELQVIEDARGGDEILEGDPGAAIATLEYGSPLGSTFSRSTNLCVAHILQRAFAAAEDYCQLARRSSTRTLTSILYNSSGVSVENAYTIAMNNLGVLQALQGRTELALDYFQRADEQPGSRSGAARRNIEALGQRHDLSEVAGL